MRGKVPPHCCFCPALGITPAYAGKSCVRHDHTYQQGDHPRVCGEKALSGAARSCCTGSPPRMRGKGPQTGQRSSISRITPAYAGKRSFCQFLQRPSWDHPRVCGEKFECTQSVRRLRGSPPRMRGKGAAARAGLRAVGITPACAGKRLWGNNRRGRNEDHPRVCGEKPADYVGYKLAKGSPPRMRGKEPFFFDRFSLPGITPAYAGKSSTLHQNDNTRRDHPRVCGEKTKKIP